MLPSINQLLENFNLEPLPEIDMFKLDDCHIDNYNVAAESEQTQEVLKPIESSVNTIDMDSDSDMNSYPQSPVMSDNFCLMVGKEQPQEHHSFQYSPNNKAFVSKKKAEFTEEEDIKLMKLVNLIGKNNWFVIGQMMGTKTGRQCKDRWMHHLNPKGILNTWTLEEDCQLIQLYAQYGPKWQKISQHITGRTCNSIRNRWRILLKHSHESLNVKM